jgi:lipoprotein-anchoring transpeptidase ErfK/SrfK
VATRRGPWLGVESSAFPNRKLAWVDGRSPLLRRKRTRVSVHVDLTRRKLTLRNGRRVVERATVGTGSRSSPTATGRFAVTDKLAGGRFSPAYGCCILALSGRQTNLPAGWQGGSRLAIHGTDAPSTIGARASAGCLHARRRDLEKLMRRVPLGAPVFIKK